MVQFLGFLLSAEYIRRTTGSDKIIHLIADEHARISKPKEDLSILEQRISEVIDTIGNTVEGLNLGQRYKLIMGSSLSNNDNYMAVYNNIDLSDSGIHEAAEGYAQRQIADMAYMHEFESVDLKLSWLIDPKAKKIGFDERFFDGLFKDIKGDVLSFVYTGAGRSLDKKRPKTSPYIFTESKLDRLKIDSTSEDIDKYFRRVSDDNGRVVSGALTQLENVVSLYEFLYGTFGKMELNEKIDSIIRNVQSYNRDIKIEEHPKPEI